MRFNYTLARTLGYASPRRMLAEMSATEWCEWVALAEIEDEERA